MRRCFLRSLVSAQEACVMQRICNTGLIILAYYITMMYKTLYFAEWNKDRKLQLFCNSFMYMQ